MYDSLGTTEWNWNRGLYDKYVHVALFCQNNQVQQYYENIFALVATTPLYVLTELANLLVNVVITVGEDRQLYY